jgi:hypothetical protein
VRFRKGQQRRLTGQKPVRKREEPVEFVPDPPVVGLGGLHHASCGDARWCRLPHGGELARANGHGGLRIDERPRQLLSADAHSIAGYEHPARYTRVVHVGPVGAAEIGQHQFVVDDLDPRVAPGDIAVV